MLSNDISNLSISINELAHKVTPEVWQFLKQVKCNLEAAAESAKSLENIPMCIETLTALTADGGNHG